ncbi:hypothetical protein DRQ36_03030 [bacterium]|nr:MAG: hypothetical protein DRQ36_03030 [bacterium]
MRTIWKDSKYPDLYLEPGERIRGFFPYSTTQSLRSGFDRITFQVGAIRFNVFVTREHAAKINNCDPPVSRHDIIEARGTEKGIFFKIVERA